MSETTSKRRTSQWLFIFCAVYLILFFFFAPSGGSLEVLRWSSFFVLTQFLVQHLFPQLRCSISENAIVLALVSSITTTIIL